MISQGEKKIISILQKENIQFIKEKTFTDLQHNGVKYRYDFFIPSLNVILEYDGSQHYSEAWGGKKELLHRQENDRKKNSYALGARLQLYRIPYWDYDKINSFNDLIQEKYKVKDKWHNDKIKPPHSY